LNGLLEGLEVSILQMSDWLNDNKFLRLDSEYQLKPYRAAIEHVRTFGATQFKDDGPVIIHPHEIVRDYVEDDGVWFLRAQNVRPLQIDARNQVLVSAQDAAKLKRNLIKKSDVLVTRTGANRGQCALFDRDETAVASSHTFLIRPQKIDPAFLAVFLNTSFGIAQIDKGVYGAAQPEVAPYYLNNIWVPNVSSNLLNEIKQFVQRSKLATSSTNQLIKKAEHDLIASLGLADWTPPEPLTYAAKASDALAAGRLDAQYFMPAKEQVKQALAALPGELLADRVSSIREQWVPDRAPPTMRVRNYDVTDALVPLLDAEKEPSFAADIGSMKKVLRDGDVAVSRLRAYLKETAVVRTGDAIPSVGSSEFIVLRPNGTDISPETLMVFLRAAPVQTILKWCQDGSQHPRFSEGDLLSIPVPDAVADVSAKVTLIVQEGFAARDRARRLLDAAKRAVEIAIDDSEAAALAYLATVEGTG
jgi:type I restriction enzyme, S subunit